MPFDFTVIARNLDYLLWGRTASGEIGGLLLTVAMAVESGIIALVLGIALALVAWRWSGWVRRILLALADLVRGVPLIFVIFWIYFLIPALFGSSVPNSRSVVIALAWFSSAAVLYSTLSGLLAIPRGQYEAGIASGLGPGRVLWSILLPQAIRNLIPSFIGLFVSLIKDTSLAFIVNVPELTYVSSQVNNRTQVYPTEIFLFAGVVYYLLCEGLTLAANSLASASRRTGKTAAKSR
jgi:polar amino acid transport system permease protein